VSQLRPFLPLVLLAALAGTGVLSAIWLGGGLGASGSGTMGATNRTARLSDEPPTVAVEVPIGMDRRAVPTPNWIARQATIGTREDIRREGALILHKVLQMRHLQRPPKVLQANTTLIYADADELLSRVDDALDGRVPVKPGTDALFALGRLVPVRIVRLGADGRVRSVEDARVSFVGFNFEEPPGQ
jgi:hypothetical protein